MAENRTEECALVLAEWEDPGEADKARLDWLENASTDEANAVLHRGALRELIDDARHAPQPKVTVIKSA